MADNMNNYRKPLTADEIKGVLTDILVYIDEVCKKHNIKYSLAYGTLIGAARHKGFIPWDDDIDIIMKQDDYLKFIELPEFRGESRYQLHCAQREKEFGEVYSYPFVKIEDSKTTMEYFVAKDKGGAFIDVFPITGLPEDKDEREAHFSSAYKLIHKNAIGLSRNNNPLKNLKNVYHYFNLKKNRDAITAKALSIPYGNCDEVADVIWAARCRGAFPAQWMEDFIELDFEGHKFSCIKEYDKMLTMYYGNWRALPPEDQRQPHHGYNMYLKD